jgi:hypothetical protein
MSAARTVLLKMANIDLEITIPAAVINDLTYEELGRVVTAVSNVVEYGAKASNYYELSEVERLAYHLIIYNRDDVDAEESYVPPFGL